MPRYAFARWQDGITNPVRSFTVDGVTPPPVAGAYIGWRSSEYGVHYAGNYDGAPQTPSAAGQKPSSWFINTSDSMAALINGVSPSGIWIFGEIENPGNEATNYPTYIDIPSPGTSYANIAYRTDTNDPHEAYLTSFDNAGMKVWLQTEPGMGDINTLTKLLMDRYGHHSCVIGIGIDAEWYNGNGGVVTTAAATSWISYLQTNYGSQYKFFVKHFSLSNVPADPKIAGLVWVDDSDGFTGGESEMLTDFGNWATHFSGSEIWFQIGYNVDTGWTRPIGVAKLSSDLLNIASNVKGIIWSDEDILHYYP